jgi:disease resistance protein RPM1
MKPLNEQDSRKLFASRAFGSVDAACPPGLEIQMNEILEKCGGLPLAIVSLGSLLASYNSSASKHMWERISRSIGSQMESNPTLKGMRQILALSYNHLPYPLKVCMMYLSTFPEDYLIEKDRLLNRWIAEGLVPQMRGLTLLEVAEAYFEELMSRSMIDRGTDTFNWYDGRVESCRVHDMMLEVMVSKSLEANFVSLIGGQYEGMSYDIDRVRRLSIHGVESKKTAAVHGSKRSGTEDMNVQHVRSLSMFELPGHKLLDRLSEFELFFFFEQG